MADQKSAFAQRLKRIESGKHFEHEDVIGHQTTKRYKKRYGDKPKRPKRTFLEKLMVVIAFLSGMSSVLAGRIVYFHLAQIEGLPPAFYDLGGRGMALFALVLAMTLIVIFHLSTRVRFQALLIGCAVMHYGEAAVASNAPEFWSQIFSAEYAAEMAAKGQDYRLTPTG
ncbi:MAG: hypothetical protein KDE08_06335 [Rhodobacteraceae bacterium]|nr:hypothetical protein [Paracoccaceae bacterium]